MQRGFTLVVLRKGDRLEKLKFPVTKVDKRQTLVHHHSMKYFKRKHEQVYQKKLSAVGSGRKRPDGIH
jgi:hypothetical protein